MPDKQNRRKRRNKSLIWYVAVTLYSLAACLVTFVAAQIAPAGIVYTSICAIALSLFVFQERANRKEEDKKLSIKIQSVSNKIDTVNKDPAVPFHFKDILQADLKKTDRADTGKKEQTVKKTRTVPPLTSKPRKFSSYTEEEDLSMFSDTIVIELIHHALEHRQIEVFAQPIVRLPQRKIYAFELLVRLRAKAGIYMPANDFMKLAEKEKLGPAIDNYLLIHCLNTIKNKRGYHTDTPFFLNITRATLSDLHFMHTLLTFLKQHKDLSHRLIFEMKQKDFESLSPKVRSVLTGLSRIGCRFSMDHIESAGLTPQLLKDRHINFIKLDASKLINTVKDEKSFLTLKKFFCKLTDIGIELVVERMENEKKLIELLDVGVRYGQGYLFGKPDREAIYKRNAA